MSSCSPSAPLLGFLPLAVRLHPPPHVRPPCGARLDSGAPALPFRAGVVSFVPFTHGLSLHRRCKRVKRNRQGNGSHRPLAGTPEAIMIPRTPRVGTGLSP